MKRLIAILMTLIMVFGLSSVGAWAEEPTWQMEKSMPTPKMYHYSASVGNKIYVFGGFISGGTCDQKVDVYDTETKTWTYSTYMPEARSKFSASVVGDKIYLIGGRDGNQSSYIAQVRIYDTTTNKWNIGASMPTPRFDLDTVSVGSKIYVFGGIGQGGLKSSIDIYDTETDTWSIGTDMITPRRELTASLVGNNIFVMGGMDASNNFTNLVEIYNIETNTWTAGQSMLSSNTAFYSSVVENNIYVIGGSAPNKELQIYNTLTNIWSTGPSMNIERRYSTMSAANGKIYVVGGGGSSSLLNSMESLQIGSTVIEPTQPLNLTAIGGNSKVDLSWGAVTDATSYNVKKSAIPGGPYTAIANVTGTSYTDTDVVNGTTYYYVVTAVAAGGESANSNEASATPQAPSTSTGKALLVITMTNGLEKEYDLQMSEVNAFINWYSSSGSGHYMFNKNFNLGPFMTRVDYIAHDKIQNFEVMQYQ